MAGIERLEVHSRSYIVRWVRVEEGNTLSWSVQPHKKSINFGIVKHPGSGATTLTSVPVDDLHSGTHHTQGVAEGRAGRFSKKDITAQELLSNKGFISIKWDGKCEADKVSIGTYDVAIGHGGMYGLVFDNTFSKQTSKTATFVVLTYPTGAAPQSANNLPNLQMPNARWSQQSLGKQTLTRHEGPATGSVESLQSDSGPPVQTSSSREGVISTAYHVGTLSKRRRKKGQGYARRFFSLDYSTCTLSYYYNRNSSALRGAIPLSLAAIAADERRREISIDSGAEVWHLKAPGVKEFQEWAYALERASRLARGLETLQGPLNHALLKVDHRMPKLHLEATHEEDVEWQQVETLVSRVVGTRDALRRLTREVAALPKPSSSHLPNAPGGFADDGGDGQGNHQEKKSFWKRKSSASTFSVATQHGAASGVPPVPTSGSMTTGSAINGGSGGGGLGKRKNKETEEEKCIQDHCEALLADLDSVVSEFTTLINRSKMRRLPVAASSETISRHSMETTSTGDEFFDAEDVGSRVVKIDASEDEAHESDADDASSSSHDNASIISSCDEEEGPREGANTLYPAKSKSLSPLPLDTVVRRRTAIPPATVLPPSLIAFVRKNVGKDLSTISMPVSANEPTSLLQKFAEQLEYAELLDEAAKQRSVTDRLLYVTAFAVSQFSSGRAKERAIRKPFNPLLGETFELVRSSGERPGGFRLLVEKVSHRPVKLAMQADSASWSMSQSPAPGQKFWGKSAEITTDGRVRVALRLPEGADELYSWNIATMFLRNVVMGEKYVEPVGTMSVVNDTTGHKAAVEFRSKGMFGGRAEDVNVETFNPDGSDASHGLVGTWTAGLKVTGLSALAGEEIWRVGALVDNSAQTYGMTAFAASLNEVTDIERDRLPPTDCRLRPDQRLAEQGRLDDAEAWKQRLEEAQRARRRAVEERGEEHHPRWFVRAEESTEDDEVWRLRTGKEGYWEERARGAWTGVEDIFDVPDE
ncbi:Oxysterol-binding protein -like protein [Escovopsis weberi]|uniref:Oxysterol-binding protein-like protein n=1 Tax=Escovopsis weberi TaxID=150374 RepID=A0A0N0RTX9_ESCWE|nr:Oxysterol-binding protein -like protein [Escovopsis weberi]